MQFTVVDVRDTRYLLSGEELRWAVNTDAADGTTLLSSFVQPVSTSNAIRFEHGHGNGHGVGLCQWCAQAEALEGLNHEKIILDAFRGAKLVRAY